MTSRIPSVGLTMLLLVSCAVKEVFIVRDNAPDLPVLTVIPASVSRNDLAAANQITELLLGFDVNLVQRPTMIKERSEYEGTSSAGGLGVTGSGGVAIVGGSAGHKGEVSTTVDPVSLVKETKAHYVFFVQSQRGGPWVKVVRRESEQILFAGRFKAGTEVSAGYRYMTEHQRMKALLTGIGILK